MSAVNPIATPIEGAIKPSSLEVDGYEALLYSHRFTQIETNQQGRWDYVSGTAPIYCGYAPRGLSESSVDKAGNDSGWLLQKFAYDGNGNITSRTIAYGNWTNHASYTYS